MAFRKIKLGPIQESGQERLAGAAPLALNVVIDGKGTAMRRPGLSAYAEAPTAAVDVDGIDAVHVTAADALYAVGGALNGRHVYKIDGGSAADLSNVVNGRIPGSLWPIVTETAGLLVFAAGSEPCKLVLATDAMSRLGGSPPIASHMVSNASRLLANDLNQIRRFRINHQQS